MGGVGSDMTEEWPYRCQSFDLQPFRLYAGFLRNMQSDDTLNKNRTQSADLLYWSGRRSRDRVHDISLTAGAPNTDVATYKDGGHAHHFRILYQNLLSKRTTVYASYTYLADSTRLRYGLVAAQPPSSTLLNRPDSGDPHRG